jgi:hypothetical protein
MDSASFDFYAIVDIFLLLLIGIGPKIALVPFLELTAEMDAGTKAQGDAKDARHCGHSCVPAPHPGRFAE